MKRRKTGGRKKGSKNKRTVELEKKAAEGQTPLDYMLEVMRDKKADSERRDEMAKAARHHIYTPVAHRKTNTGRLARWVFGGSTATSQKKTQKQ
jgi:hypothetical protein